MLSSDVSPRRPGVNRGDFLNVFPLVEVTRQLRFQRSITALIVAARLRGDKCPGSDHIPVMRGDRLDTPQNVNKTRFG